MLARTAAPRSNGPHTQLHPPAGDSRNVDQVLDELPEDTCVALKDRYRLLGSFRIGGAAVERGGPAEDHVQRRAQLVRHRGDQLVARLQRPLEGGHQIPVLVLSPPRAQRRLKCADERCDADGPIQHRDVAQHLQMPQRLCPSVAHRHRQQHDDRKFRPARLVVEGVGEE